MEEEIRHLYLELIKKNLTDSLRKTGYLVKYNGRKGIRLNFLENYLKKKYGLYIAEYIPYNEDLRHMGYDWPLFAETMIGIMRLNNIQNLIESIIKLNIPGDFIETGAWRGGATIFMRAVLKAYNITDRIVWVADSFQGLPKPDGEKYPSDRGDVHYTKKELSVKADDVRQNFLNYQLFDDQVRFLEGWFKETLPLAPIKQLSLLRLDGDMYESTMDALTNLYPKLSRGGYVIIDDWEAVPACKQAVIDFRGENSITDEIVMIDWSACFWQKK